MSRESISTVFGYYASDAFFPTHIASCYTVHCQMKHIYTSFAHILLLGSLGSFYIVEIDGKFFELFIFTELLF